MPGHELPGEAPGRCDGVPAAFAVDADGPAVPAAEPALRLNATCLVVGEPGSGGPPQAMRCGAGCEPALASCRCGRPAAAAALAVPADCGRSAGTAPGSEQPALRAALPAPKLLVYDDMLLSERPIVSPPALVPANALPPLDGALPSAPPKPPLPGVLVPSEYPLPGLGEPGDMPGHKPAAAPAATPAAAAAARVATPASLEAPELPELKAERGVPGVESRSLSWWPPPVTGGLHRLQGCAGQGECRQWLVYRHSRAYCHPMVPRPCLLPHPCYKWPRIAPLLPLSSPIPHHTHACAHTHHIFYPHTLLTP